MRIKKNVKYKSLTSLFEKFILALGGQVRDYIHGQVQIKRRFAKVQCCHLEERDVNHSTTRNMKISERISVFLYYFGRFKIIRPYPKTKDFTVIN